MFLILKKGTEGPGEGLHGTPRLARTGHAEAIALLPDRVLGVVERSPARTHTAKLRAGEARGPLGGALAPRWLRTLGLDALNL